MNKERLLQVIRDFTPIKSITNKINLFKEQIAHEEEYLRTPRVTLYPETIVSSVENNRSNPKNCLLIIDDSEISRKSPLVVFPDVLQCMILVGRKGSTNFFGHLSPETVTLGQEEEIKKLIEMVRNKEGENGEFEIYYVDRGQNNSKSPEEVQIVSRLLSESGLKVAERRLDSRLEKKSFAYDLNEKRMKIVNNYSSAVFKKGKIGAFFDKPIFTLEG